jgi:hypothetical protein
MLSIHEIQQIVDAHKAVFATKEDLLELRDTMRKDFGDLQTTVDGYAKKMNDHDIEIKVLNRCVTKLENPV